MSLVVIAPLAVYLLLLAPEVADLLRGRGGRGRAGWRLPFAGIALAGALALCAYPRTLLPEWEKRKAIPIPGRKAGIDDSMSPGTGRAGVFWHIHYFSKHYGVDPLLVRALIEVESEFNPRAVSRMGAKGLMQINPLTAKHLGISDVFDVRENIKGGVRYLRHLLELYGWNLRMALASYNAGPANVQRYKGIPPFPETRRHVARVMAAYERLKRTERAFGGKARRAPALPQSPEARPKADERAR